MRRLLPALLVLLAAAPALANDTELHDGAYGPEPVGGGLTGPESVIRMAREHLGITFGRKATDVVATFTFVNTLAGQTAHQLVGFPDFGAAGAEAARRIKRGQRDIYTDPYDTTKPLLGFSTFVNDRAASAQLKYGYVKPRTDGGPGWTAGKPGDMLMAWYAVPVDFPPGKEVNVERRYRAPVGDNVLGVTFFKYVTHTGGVWQGPIGLLVADVTLADGLTTKDLVWPGEPIPKGMGAGVFPDNSVTMPNKPAWQIKDPTHMRLVWTDFEPRLQRDRAGFALVARAK
ncbi:MAG: hypothetical protein JWM80_3436 [Cyanobacteria bacterium RYN_339]|nr:hypothetical protein [Cyanobacteria bacterium RYN_339]